MRFIGSLIKYFIYLCLFLIAVGAALFWFDTGSWLVQPLALRAGNFFLAPLKLEIANIKGSVHDGFALEKLKLISGDEDLFTLDYASASPDWDLILKGMDGLPFVKDIKIYGASSDLDKVMKLAGHFAVSEDKDKEKKHFNLALNPFNIEVKDVNFATPYANLKLDALNLDGSGNLFLDSKIISDEANIFPVKANATVKLNPIEIISSDLILGHGTGSLSAAIEPLKANLTLNSLSLDELLKFAPDEIKDAAKISGLINAGINAQAQNDFIKANGFIAMPEAKVMDMPLDFSVPFDWDGVKNFSLVNAALNSEFAKINLNRVSVDIDTLKILADGTVKNLSLTEIGRVFAPELKLKGTGGNIDFDIDTAVFAQVNEILANTRADIKADIPLISLKGINVLENLSAKIGLAKKTALKLDANGRVFGGKIFARGEVNQDLRPQAVVSLVNIDVPTLINLVPDLAKSIKKPYGKISVRTIIDENLNLNSTVTSEKLSANDFAFNNIKAVADYKFKDNTAGLESFSANFGKALITANGGANLNTGAFSAELKTENLDPKIIPTVGLRPELKNLKGVYNFTANASGNYNKIESIKADAVFMGQKAGWARMNFGDFNLPISWADNILKISRAKANLPGGALNLDGKVNLKNTGNPDFDMALSTTGINLAELLKALNLQAPDMKVSGKVSGQADLKGTLKNPSFNAALRAEKVKAGTLADIPEAVISANGNMKKISLNKFNVKLNGSDIKGSGELNINEKDFNASKINFSAKLKHLNLKKTLASLMGSPSPIDGVIDADAFIKGTVGKPEGGLNLTRPVFYGKNEIRDIALKLNSPENNHYKINARARLENFKPEADIDIKNQNGVIAYEIKTKPLDINSAVESQMPSLSGIAKGLASINITGNTKANSNINIRAFSNEIKIMDKIKIKNISLPLIFSLAKNKIEMKDGTASLSDGKITTKIDVDLTKKTYEGKVSVSSLDFGKLAGEFLTEGEIVGKANAEANIKGNFSVMPMSFANGKFSTTPGYIHKMSIIDKVTPTKKITFENISGSFFWDGKDVFLNPGTGATAGSDEPLYRYVHVNGSLGVPGKGLNLFFDGRFDLKILDQLLGAMKGLFQYMTGNVAQNFLKDAAGRIFGVKRRDFQTVSFRLANSWDALRLLDLKITKPIEDFLPIDILNKDEEKQRDDTQFKLNLKIPVGKGDPSIEEESPGDQFKQQLIDNLFNVFDY